jgi:hypothetical protein
MIITKKEEIVIEENTSYSFYIDFYTETKIYFFGIKIYTKIKPIASIRHEYSSKCNIIFHKGINIKIIQG